MPRLSQSLPKIREHKASGQAYIFLDGQQIYLGPHGSEVAASQRDRIVAEWLVNGRRLPTADEHSGLTLNELMLRYLQHAKAYYRKGGVVTNEVQRIQNVCKILRDLYGGSRVNEFGPKKLRAVRQVMIDRDFARKEINKQIDRIKRMFKWATSEELVKSDVYQGLRALSGLRKGRSEAKETAAVGPVGDDVIDRTLPHLSGIVGDMVRIQRYIGARPEEICHMRPCDIDRRAEVWEYRPFVHKNEHHEESHRVILIGPKAQALLLKYLQRDRGAFCFSPKEANRQRCEARCAGRRTPLSCGNRPGTNRKANPKRSANDRYSTDTYGKAIARACERAWPPVSPEISQRADETVKAWHARLKSTDKWQQLLDWNSRHRWSPNQLRHARGTEVRAQFGLDAAQATLGHARCDVTQVYAEKNVALARDVAARTG